MNKTLILAVVIILLSSVVSASASNDHSNGHPNDEIENQQTPTIAVTPTPQGDTNCDDNLKNHGVFVSCIAHEHLGGNSVSDAAQSNIGKKDETDNDPDEVNPTISPTITPSLTPTATPTVTPTTTLTPTLTVTPTITVTPTPNLTVTPTITVTPGSKNERMLGAQISGLVNEIKNLINLLTYFTFLHK